MKIAVIQSKDLDLTGCWSAIRFTGGCASCPRVEKCKMPEAEQGRTEILQEKIRKGMAEVHDAIKRLREKKQELKNRRG